MNSSTYKNTVVGSWGNGLLDNVDVLFSVVGGSKPPSLPLREERQTDGVELVYNAKGTGYSAVCKEQERRETQLLDKLKRLEKKLERKASYRRTKKRQKALKMVRLLKHQLENSASGISYERYFEELRQLRLSLRGSASIGHQNSDISEASTINIESKIMNALQTLLDDPELGFENFDNLEEDDSAYDDRTTDSSFLSVDPSVAITADSVISYIDDEEEEDNDDHNEWQNDPVDTNSISDRTSMSVTTDYTSKTMRTGNIDPNSPKEKNPRDPDRDSTVTLNKDDEIQVPIPTTKSVSAVRFKDVKPSVYDNLAHARALLNNARELQNSFSNESSSSLETKPKIKSVMNKAVINVPQIVSGELVGREEERYHLFVSHACSWSHRCLLIRALKRLQKFIDVSYVHCEWQPQALWESKVVADIHRDVSFWSITGNNVDDDAVMSAFKEHWLDKQISEETVRVPILWDKKENKIMSDQSVEIMKILNFKFNRWSKRPKLNLFPAGFQTENEDINRWLHHDLCISIYKCGVATSQEQYDESIQDVTAALDKAERIVKKRGFLAGRKLTESDIRLFVLLLRFDEVYRVLFKVNTRMIIRMPGLMDFMRDIYDVAGIKDICEMDKIKNEFFGIRGTTFIIPKGGAFMDLITKSDI